MAPPWALLHGLIPVHGTLGTVLDVLFYLSLLLTAFAVVLVSEEDRERAWKLKWGAFVVLVPVVGPAIYLYSRSRNG